MQRFGRLKVTDLNPHLSCILCGGYFIDATTIIECLHSFCRACIVRYLETSKYCPVCEVQVHKSRPLHYIRSDKTLQDIVYKLVPGLFHNEMKMRRELYASQPPEAIKESRDSEDRGECLDEKLIFSPEEIFSLSLEFDQCKGEDEPTEELDDNDPRRRFLRCPAALTVAHIKKFIRLKYGIPNTYEIVLRFEKEFLLDEYSLMDVAYLSLWRRNGPIRLYYRIMIKPPKRLKTHHVTDNTTEIDAKPQQDETKSDAPTSEDQQKDSATNPKNEVHSVTAENHPIVKNSDTVKPPEKSDVKSQASSEAHAKKSVKADSESNKDWKLPIKEDSKVVITDKEPVLEKDNAPPKPAVMTVSPLPKSEITASMTMSTGGVTVGHYTGISIKKSPPNTLPPFRISSHLLPPRVPPLKLSPPRFSRLEACVRQISARDSSPVPSKKSKSSSSSRVSSDKTRVPLIIPVPPKAKESRHKSDDPKRIKPKTPEAVAQKEPKKSEVKSFSDDEKMDLDLFGGPLVIAEPEKEDEGVHLPKDDSKAEDEDEEIDVVDDGEADSGRGSDISSRAEARSLSGDDDIGSPSSVKTPEEPEKRLPEPKKSLPNGVKCNGNSQKDDFGVLDLSTCGRKRIFPREDLAMASIPLPRSMQVANPAVLDKSRQTVCPKDNPFKLLPSALPAMCKKPDSGSRNFRCRGSTMTVYNPDPNSCRPKIIIKNLDPRPDHGKHHHHHHHNHHHQRM